MDKKIKILFCLQTMVMGGVEKELATVLKKFDPAKYDIELLLFYVQDEAMIKTIPPYVKLTVLDIDRSYWLGDAKSYIISRLLHGHLIEAIKIAFQSIVKKGASSAYINLRKMKSPEGEYDYAVCYHMHSAVMLRYVAEKVKAKHKIAWIHNDFSTTGFKVWCYGKDLAQYEKFVAVSDQLNREFAERCPQYSDRTVTVHNIVDEEEILLKSQEKTDEMFESDQRTKLVTVGRYVEQKGYDLAIQSCRYLIENGYDVSWYAIGWGPEEENMRAMVKELHLENSFFILGRKDNPYPYIAGADVYVQPSKHEGFGLVLAEAKALGKKVVATDFAGAREQLEEANIALDFTPETIGNCIIKNLSTSEGIKVRQCEADFDRFFQLFEE